MIIASNTYKVAGAIVILLLCTSCTSTETQAETETKVLYCIGACIHVIQKTDVATSVATEKEADKSEEP